MNELYKSNLNAASWRGLCIEVAETFSAAEAAWRAARTSAAGYLFQDYDWLTLWYATAGVEKNTRPCLVRVADGKGRTLLFLPLGVRRLCGYRVLIFLGGGVSDYKAPIVDRAFAATCMPEDFNDLWQTIMRCLPPVDLVWLTQMPALIEDVPNPMVLLRHSEHNQEACAIKPLPADYETFRKTHRSRVFRDAGRKLRKVTDEVGPVSFEIVETKEDILQTVDIAMRQKRENYGASCMPPTYEAFYKGMAVLRIEGGQPLVYRLKVNDFVAATYLGVLYDKRFYCLIPSYEGGKWARYSLGRVLTVELLKWCMAHGVETFDMTVGTEEYKSSWTDSTMPLYACRYVVTLKGYPVLALLRLNERLKKNPKIEAFIIEIKRRFCSF